MKNKNILNEKFNKTEVANLKSIVRKEIEAFKKKKVEDLIRKEIQSQIKKLSLEDLDSKFEESIEDIFRSMMQKYHEMFYREKHIIKNKLKL